MVGMNSLIGSKLNPPLSRPNLVSRPRLSLRLNAGLRPECRLILISAPAGYGKTTLAATWLAGLRVPYAWLSLEETENDPVRFLAYLGAALEKITPEFGAYVDSLAGIPQLPGAETVAAELINAMPPLPDSFVLALDDYHSITHSYPHSVIRTLIQHLPPNFHLLIATREDPPFSLNRLRVQSEITEVRMDDLRFTAEEAGEFLRAMGLALQGGAVATCVGRTEGWAAGIQLAALSLQRSSSEEAEAFLAAFSGSHRYIIDYLVDEVLSRQEPPIQEFLRLTSVLDRFTASLCDRVTGREDSREVLRGIEASNLFLIPLDGEREWYRYHHLFADSLRAELDKSVRAGVHRRAAGWFEEQGDLPGAVKQALAAGELAEAARLIAAAAPGMLLRGELATLRDWLAALPKEAVYASDDLITVKPWALCLTGRLREAGAFLAEVSEARRADLPALPRGALFSMEAMISGHRGDVAQAADFAQEALRLIDGKIDPVSRASTLNILGQSLQRLGDMNGAEQAFHEACELAGAFPRTFVSILTTVTLSYFLDLRGRRREAEAICRRHYQAILDGTGRPLPFGGILAAQLGVLSYEANELVAARSLLETGVDLCRALSLHQSALSEERLALTLDALGEHEAALEVLLGANWPDAPPDALFSGAAVEAEIKRRNGEIDAVQRWAKEWSLAPDDPPNVRRESGYLTYIRLLLDLGRPEQATVLLNGFASKAEEMGRISRLIPLRVLQASALAALHRREEAAAMLRGAVALAAPEDYLRAFLDQGPAVAPLLGMARDIAPAFVDRLAASFSMPEAGPSEVHARLVEPLTEREEELLKLLAEGLSNDEISRRLYISPNTTKWHLKSIFGKLAVGSRTQAVAKAREIGLI